MFDRNKKSQYDQQLMNRAITSAVLRIVVAAYIIFIAYNVINGTRSEDSSIPAWAGMLIGGLFMAAAAGFIIYSIRSFLKARENARLDPDAENVPKKEEVSDSNMSIAEKVRSAQAKIAPTDSSRQDDKDH